MKNKKLAYLNPRESYFNELINRSMIQRVRIDVEGIAETCHVHGIMLDLTRSLSSEENFVTILDIIAGSRPNSHSNVHMLSLHGRGHYPSVGYHEHVTGGIILIAGLNRVTKFRPLNKKRVISSALYHVHNKILLYLQY